MISAADSVTFGRLITALSDDVVLAHVHWRLHCDLIAAIKKDPIVWAQSRTFWHLTITAHSATAVSHLCRAFDQEQSSLHLHSWLKTIRDNLHLFEVSEFRQRLANNAFVDSLATSLERPDPAVLDSDISLCVATDPLVRKLVAYRGSSVAHRSARRAANRTKPPENLAVSAADIELLLERAHTIFNRYSRLFSATTYSVKMIGHDDYEYIFRSVASAVSRSRQRGAA